jgi:hypothetical protein
MAMTGLVSRGRTALWTVVALLLGPPFLLSLFLVVGLVTDTTIELDVALITLAVAAVVLAVGFVHLVRHWMRPKNVVQVGYDLKLTQPAVPMGRYEFRLSIHYLTQERGKRHVHQQASIVMKFKGKDHPDLLAWCSSQVSTHLEQHREAAQRLHPGAEVIVSPAPSREQLVEKVTPPAGAKGA